MSTKVTMVVGGASLILAVTACSNGRSDRPGFDTEQTRSRPMIFVSPAGKPYRNTQAATPPIAQWFRVADTDGDGVLRYDELRNDFASTFDEFDRDGDGDIQGPEVIHYEQEIFPEISAAARGGDGGGRSRRAGAGRGRDQDRGRGGGGGRPSSAGQNRSGGQARHRDSTYRPGGAARFGLLPIHHPILQADTDIDRRVTHQEFQSASDLRFGLLDEDNDGAVTLDQLVQMMAQRRSERGRR